MNRPSFNPLNGCRIRYSDSPMYDINGYPIVYGEDRSDVNRWNQLTGEPNNVNVTVNVTQAQQVPAQVAAQAPAPAPDRVAMVTVRRLADNVYETFPSYNTNGGQTVRSIRAQFANQLGLRDTMIAIVDGEAVGEGVVVDAGATVTFREGAKARG